MFGLDVPEYTTHTHSIIHYMFIYNDYHVYVQHFHRNMPYKWVVNIFKDKEQCFCSSYEIEPNLLTECPFLNIQLPKSPSNEYTLY